MTAYEQTSIPGGGEQTDSWEHPDIKNAFDPLDTTEAVEQAQKYWEVHQLWEQGLATFARSIQNSISQSWSGPAAEEAKASIARYAADAQQLSPALAEMYTRVRDAATAIVDTKNAIPEPVEVSWTSWAWPPHRWDLQREQSEAAQVARTEMRQRYVEPFGQVDGQIPVLPTPISPTVSPDIAAPPPGRYVPAGGTGDLPGATGPVGSGVPGTGTPSAEDAEKSEENGEGVPESTEEQLESTEQPDGTETTPAGTVPSSTNQQATSNDSAPRTTNDPSRTVPASTVPTSTVSTSTTPSSTPGYTPSGTPTSSPGSPSTTNQPGPGRSIPGGPGSTAAPAAAAAAATQAQGTRSATGYPGMFGGGAGRGRGAGDSEHQRPDYLVNQENTDELLGEIPRMVAGGVIGGDRTEPPR
ncbi:hypothetical protein [Nocardia asteroides]|uniref:hypothetical protein n=1 Tax=Nocardia asteroides TaxID=1824 RepID=UPI001E50108A|nr:hypothetical protein [Nocardia asteroides]UGT60510.1 hypothetical protein LTT61_25530 [Nocardia asteroides]